MRVIEDVGRRLHLGDERSQERLGDERNQERKTHGELPRVFSRQVAASTGSGAKIADNKRQPATAQIDVLVSHGEKAPSAQHCVNGTTYMYYTCWEMETACFDP